MCIYYCYCTNTDHTCFHGPVPILNITAHQTTIRGEVITFTCWFGGNYSPDTEVAYEIYWKVFQDGNLFFIDDGMNHTGYQLMPPSPYCNNSDSSFLCCQFISELKINSSVVSHDVSVGCNALTNNQPSKSLTSSLSELCTEHKALQDMYVLHCLFNGGSRMGHLGLNAPPPPPHSPWGGILVNTKAKISL